MPRYIDADKANENFEEVFCKNCNSYHGLKCRACSMRDGADIFFNDAPTEDVQPVIHAKWKPTWTKNEAYCSRCNGFVTYNPLFATDKYCRFCGAKMDKE